MQSKTQTTQPDLAYQDWLPHMRHPLIYTGNRHMLIDQALSLRAKVINGCCPILLEYFQQRPATFVHFFGGGLRSRLDIFFIPSLTLTPQA